MAVTGGGSRAISDLLSEPGASRTVLEATVPYSAAAMAAWLGSPPEQYCSEPTARAVAAAALERARVYLPEELETLIGLGCTASLASDRPKRGEHRVHVAWHTVRGTESQSLVLHKDARARLEEERICAALVLSALAAASGLADRVRIPLLEGENITTTYQHARDGWTDLALGQCDRTPAEATLARPPTGAVFPGAFHPIHPGHRTMLQIAAGMLGEPIALEISVLNVDKPPLDFIEIEQRLRGLESRPVWLTRAPTFVEKARVFPGATFIVGADTIRRIADPKYYGADAHRAAEAIGKIVAAGCKFLVFGRKIDGRFHALADLDLPEPLRGICREVPAEAFREDVSSTELRQVQGEEGNH